MSLSEKQINLIDVNDMRSQISSLYSQMKHSTDIMDSFIKENNASKDEEPTKLSGGGKTKKKKRRKRKYTSCYYQVSYAQCSNLTYPVCVANVDNTIRI